MHRLPSWEVLRRERKEVQAMFLWTVQQFNKAGRLHEVRAGLRPVFDGGNGVRRVRFGTVRGLAEYELPRLGRWAER